MDFLSGDVTVIQVRGNWDKLTIFNIYNNCQLVVCMAQPEAVSQAKPGPNRPGQAGPK
jgi:hypothetical protein